MSYKSASAHELGERLKAARDARGWTQKEFAAQIRRDQSEVSRWERGRVMPEYDTIVMLAGALGVDVSALLEEGEEWNVGVPAGGGLLAMLERESWAAEARARAAVIEAEAARERAVAARLAEENARDLRQGISSGLADRAALDTVAAALARRERPAGAGNHEPVPDPKRSDPRPGKQRRGD